MLYKITIAIIILMVIAAFTSCAYVSKKFEDVATCDNGKVIKSHVLSMSDGSITWYNGSYVIPPGVTCNIKMVFNRG